MKNKKFALFAVIIIFACPVQALRQDVKRSFVATTEKEMYELFNQMLDSARLSNFLLYRSNFPNSRAPVSGFAFDWFDEIESRDTLMKFVQYNDDHSFVSERFYRSYLSNSMPVEFYERFLEYLKQQDVIENLFIKRAINVPLTTIGDILIRQYESRKLNQEDSIKARRLIEETMLRRINDDHDYSFLSRLHKYVSDDIRQALINVIENPFYPAEYLDFFMSKQDTTAIDTTGIPADIRRPRWNEQFTQEELEIFEKELSQYKRLQRFRLYERFGREIYNGMSAGQAYLQRRRDAFPMQGYLFINGIAAYAYRKQDELLIKHLKKFRERHPDYPLRHFRE